MSEHLDDLKDLQIAEQHLADYQARKTRTLTVAEVKANLGLKD